MVSETAFAIETQSTNVSVDGSQVSAATEAETKTARCSSRGRQGISSTVRQSIPNREIAGQAVRRPLFNWPV